MGAVIRVIVSRGPMHPPARTIIEILSKLISQDKPYKFFILTKFTFCSIIEILEVI